MKKEEIISQLKKAQKIIDTCLTALDSSTEAIPVRKTEAKVKGKKSVISKVDFSLNERNFIMTYAKGLSSAKKFTLLLAYMAQGKTNTDIDLGVISTKWGKMTAKDLLGCPFNRKYSTEAKTFGWIDSKKKGTYQLRNNWMNIFY